MPAPIILAIDDEEEILSTISLVLSHNGYKVITAKGGADGLHSATIEHPDLVLLDVMMPDVDGYEVLRLLKERKIRTRVIFLTAKVAYPRDLIVLARSGVCDYITKPFSPTELLNSVKRALEIENPFDLRSDDLAPIVNELLANATKLNHESQNFKINAETLENNNQKLIDDIHTLGNTNHKLKNELQSLKFSNQKQLSTIRELEEKNQLLKKQIMWWAYFQRLTYLAASIVVSLILYKVGIFTGAQSALAFSLLVFILLLLPIERIRNLYAKTPKGEVGIDISNQGEKGA